LSGAGGRLAYTEKTGERVKLVDGRVVSVRPDPTDRDVWFDAMPGLGRWVTEEAMQALYEEMGAELFARECLCVWDPEPGGEGSVIPAEAWLKCRDVDSKRAGTVAFSFDVTPDRHFAAIGAAGASSHGAKVHIEVVDHRSGTGWVVPRLVELRDRYSPVSIVFDDSGPAGGLAAAAKAAGLELVTVNTREHAQACGGLLDSITDGDVVHIGQTELGLEAAVAGADKRAAGDSAWLWSRKNSMVDISPLVAVTLAKWAWENAEQPEASAACW
jgi:hypothetical protein